MATDHRTGKLFAAKQFATSIARWDAKVHLEIAILQEITHVMLPFIRPLALTNALIGTYRELRGLHL